MSAKAVTQSGRISKSKREPFFIVAGGILLLGLLGLAVFVLWNMLTPAPYRSIGALSDFPVSDSPYEVTVGDAKMFVVNTGDDFYVLDASTPAIPMWHVEWNPVTGRFHDPGSGSSFAADGSVVKGPALRDLARLPYRIEGDEVLVDLSAPAQGDMELDPALLLDY